ncbi:sigma-70 family RNA polymerase sigma factor [Cohnella sp. WQ 127256]|uniref:sigma-70 family RNA polymerase sigma factor n=1 Tax=Cohnella sp. WQ 127256 TaxID=2938790 RepID=UPI002119393F|nr:sigma-70 family RNA polymerase sigma factor [Cohnella sp. WQ 127256]
MSQSHSARLPDDAIEIMLEYQKTLCNDLASQLIRNYEPMVKMAANKISRNRPDLFDDLFQVGQMSMFRLLKQFDPSLGVPFEPYAMKSIIGHMKNYLRDKSWYIQVPRRVKEKGLLVQRAIDELMSTLERSPNVEEIAQYLELDTEETLEILAGRDLYHYVSLDTPISEDDSAAVLSELIGSTVDDFSALERKLDLDEAMNHLKQDEQDVLKMVFERGLSQRAIADEMGVSQMSISRIQKRAIDKLKLLIQDAGLEGD